MKIPIEELPANHPSAKDDGHLDAHCWCHRQYDADHDTARRVLGRMAAAFQRDDEAVAQHPREALPKTVFPFLRQRDNFRRFRPSGMCDGVGVNSSRLFRLGLWVCSGTRHRVGVVRQCIDGDCFVTATQFCIEARIVR